MPNDSLVARIVCPYFARVGATSITCESLAGATIKLNFGGYRQRTTWVAEHCERYDAGKCPVAEIIGRQYEEGED